MLLLILFFTVSSCIVSDDKVIHSLGEYNDYDFYSQGAFQDYTDYAKYYFDSVDLTDNKYFSKCLPTDLDVIGEFLDGFERLIETFGKNDASLEIVLNYDFDRSLIDTEDYFYMDVEEHTSDYGYTFIASYDIYFFDIQTNTLYYFHNNI